ncbi:MAG: protein kinase domain-containing protein [Planctomycetota bacterium]
MSSGSGLFGQKFQIQKKLGEGGMGAVYKALDVKLNRLVAIKVLQASVAGNEMFKSRFQKEARSQAKFNHPNIVILYDSDFTSEGQPYMVMEFIEGMPLDEYLRQHGALPLDRLMALFSQIAGGVAVAHHEQVIHRDLKPANLMLTKDSTGQEVIKILDLGLAKMVEAATGQDEVHQQKTMGATQAGMVLGTPQYMSPEQATGGDVDCRTDVYALGMILCEMATGKLPYNATSAMQWIAKQISEVPQPPTKIRPDLKLPKALDQVFNKAVDKDPGKRYATAQEMYEDLVRRLAEEGFSYGQGKSSIVIIKQKSNAGLVLLLILMLLLLTGAGAGGYVWWVHKREDSFLQAMSNAQHLRDNAFTPKDGIEAEGLNNALQQYDLAKKYADSAEDNSQLQNLLSVAVEVQGIGKDEAAGDYRRASARLSTLIASKAAWIDTKKFGAERDRLDGLVAATDAAFNKQFSALRDQINESLKTAAAADVPKELGGVCDVASLLVPQSDKSGFEQARGKLLTLYNNGSTTAQTVLNAIEDLSGRLECAKGTDDKFDDQVRVRQALIELMALRFDELARKQKDVATQASKANQGAQVTAAANIAIGIYTQSQTLVKAGSVTPSSQQLDEGAKAGITNCQVLIEAPGIADLLEKFVDAHKAAQDAMDKEQWSDAEQKWRDTAALADQLMSGKISKEELQGLLGPLPEKTEFSGNTLRNIAELCAEREVYQKQCADALNLWAQAQQDQHFMGDAIRSLDSAVKLADQLTGAPVPIPSNVTDLRKKQKAAHTRLLQLFENNLKMGQDLFDRKQFGDAQKAWQVAADLGKLFGPDETPADLATLPDKLHDAQQQVIFQSGIAQLQASLVQIDKLLRTEDPESAAKEMVNAQKFQKAVIAAGYEATIQDEAARLAAVPAAIAGERAYLAAMVKVQAASTQGKEDWVAVLKGYRIARDAVRGLPADYQPKVDFDNRIAAATDSVKTAYALADQTASGLLKKSDFLGAFAALTQQQALGDVLEGTDKPASLASVAAQLERCRRHNNPPVLDLGNNVKIEFVYVESPRGNFYMGKTEITNIQYEQIVKNHYVKRPDFQKQNGDNQPVVLVSYLDCRAYCAKLAPFAQKLNPKWSVRMPTQAEWIDAAGWKADSGLDPSKGTILTYPWGSQMPDPPTKNFMNYSGMESEDFTDNVDRYKLDGYLNTAPVGSFPLDKSPSGCMDMGGNVQEWTALNDPKAEAGTASQKRICKGGSFHHSAMACKIQPDDNYVDEKFIDDAGSDYVGFRVLLDIGESGQ